MQPRIFIASPLFNKPQIELIEQIEEILIDTGYGGFYSARLHSGSDKLSSEQKKDIKAWDPVFESNIQGLDSCRVMIAVLDYRLPGSLALAQGELVRTFGTDGREDNAQLVNAKPIVIPDAGTVWEMGYHRAQGKIVIGLTADEAGHLNLMLTHGCDAMVAGLPALEKFLSESGPKLPEGIVRRIERDRPQNPMLVQDASGFDWTATTYWDAATKEVE